jgi:K+-sensing histidine kinase KdpD
MAAPKSKRLLENKFILYLFFVIALIQIIVYLNCGEIQYVALLFLTGWAVSRFNKNMVIVLFSAIISTFVIKFFVKSVREGIDETTDTTTAATTAPAVSAGMSAESVQETLKKQEEAKAAALKKLNDMVLENNKNIANLNKLNSDAQQTASTTPDISTTSA